MDDDLRDKLARMTVANGATLNEEAIAKAKIAKYSSFIKKEKQAQSPRVYESETPFHEQQFLREWYQLKMANRKKWKVE